MGRHTKASRSWTVAAVLSLCACSPATAEPPDWVQRGRHVTLEGYGVPEDELCVDTLEQLDAVTEGVAAWHGWPGDALELRYRLVDSDSFYDDGATWCPPDASGCARGATITSPSPHHFHEISHAVDFHFLDVPSRLIAEGLAHLHRAPHFEDFVTHHWTSESSEHPGDLAQILEELPRDVPEGGRAGHFVSFLVDTYGVETLHELAVALPAGSELAAWETAADEVLGSTMDQVLADYAVYPGCSLAELRSKVWECSGPVGHVLPEDELTLDIELDCGQPGVLGMDGGILMTHLRVEVPEPLAGELYEVQLTGEEGKVLLESVLMEKCGVSCAQGPHVLSQSSIGEDNPFVDVHAFHAGVYAIVVRGRAGLHQLRIRRL